MSEGEKLLISLSVVTIGMFGIPLCYALYRARKIAKTMQMARYLGKEKEGKSGDNVSDSNSL